MITMITAEERKDLMAHLEAAKNDPDYDLPCNHQSLIGTREKQ